MPFLQHVKVLAILIKMFSNKIQIQIEEYNMIQFRGEIFSVKKMMGMMMLMMVMKIKVLTIFMKMMMTMTDNGILQQNLTSHSRVSLCGANQHPSLCLL